MKIYVQSRGYDSEKDYRWIQIFEDGAVKEQLPPLSKNAIALIESSSPSVVLERLPDEDLLLLITGLEAEGSLDIINRQIRIDVAFVAGNTDENQLALCQLAARALIEEKRQLLTAAVSQAVELLKNPDCLQLYPGDIDKVKVALEESDFNDEEELAAELKLPAETVSSFCEGKPVKFQDFVEIDKKLTLNLTGAKEIYLPPDGKSSLEEENIYTNFVEYGFYVSFSKLLEVASAEEIAEVSPGEVPDLTKKIGSNSPELRKKLAEEILRCKLPPETAPLVVVTGFTKMETLTEAKIWRGLSKLVESDGWTEIAQSQPEKKLSLSMLRGVVSGWLKSVSEYLAKNNDEDYF